MPIECSICCDHIFSSDSATEDICATKCGHVYHERCLCDWLQRSVECPHCRTKLGREDYNRLFLDCEQKAKKNEQYRRSNENMTTGQAMESILAENAANRSRHLATIWQHREIETSIVSLAKNMVDDSLKICKDIRCKLLYPFGVARAASSRVTGEKIAEVLGDVAAFEAKVFLRNMSLIDMSERVEELQTGKRMPHPDTTPAWKNDGSTEWKRKKFKHV